MKLAKIPLAALVVCAAGPARAQMPERVPPARSQPGWSLRRTMREMEKAYEAQGFFPTRGEWSWTLTTRYRANPTAVGLWRFPAAQTDSVLADSPVCGVFPLGTPCNPYDFLPEEPPRPWRRVSATRFVPPDAGRHSATFVEWRRENGRWVISSLGTEEEYWPRLLGRSIDEAVPGPRVLLKLPLADTARVAAGQPWYENDEPITVAGVRLVKYGLPRQLAEGDVVRWGTLHGVGVYVEPRTPRVPQIVYLVVDRGGSFQPYQDER
ncbi:MAG TPA: hypothetical protein VFJ16_14445 [Longimicrobium sp.]|nr:hypothetical protein [Longimicrobium sp.]